MSKISLRINALLEDRSGQLRSLGSVEAVREELVEARHAYDRGFDRLSPSGFKKAGIY